MDWPPTVPGTYDPDLDNQPPTSTARRGPLSSYQRFIVNPLLAVLGALPAILVIRAGFRSHDLNGFLGGFGLLGLMTFLIQFHCLDCGRTGWIVTAWRHACPGVTDRWRAGRRGRWPPPRLKVQLVLWVYVIAAGALAFAVLALKS